MFPSTTLTFTRLNPYSDLKKCWQLFHALLTAEIRRRSAIYVHWNIRIRKGKPCKPAVRLVGLLHNASPVCDP